MHEPSSARVGFRDLTLDRFVEVLSSAEPVPGGGSASAVAAALGAALVAMVAALSEGRPRYAEHAALIADAGAGARSLADQFLEIADEDAAAYAAFGAAARLPRETDEQREERAAAMASAARDAALVPLRCVEACARLVRLADALAGRSNVNAASDLRVAALLGEAAANGAAANVLINLPVARDDAWAEEVRARTSRLLEAIERDAGEACRVAESGEARPPLAAAGR